VGRFPVKFGIFLNSFAGASIVNKQTLKVSMLEAVPESAIASLLDENNNDDEEHKSPT